ncbi:MAG: type II 3-dehydroquinate dehydratase [Acidimicrobiia bacterium]
MQVLVLNGPNLNLLGARDPDVYGPITLGELEVLCRRWGAESGIDVETYQSNHEGDLIDRLHDAIGDFDGVVINPGALTHYSYALRDAIEATGIPTVEVHLSNIMEREDWRRRSVLSDACMSTVYGQGVEGYRMALHQLATLAGG